MKALCLAVAISVLTICSACNQQAHTTASTCQAGPDEKCPSDIWLNDYQKIKDYQKKYQAPQDEQDMITGISIRLQKEVPAGYTWDEPKMRFVKLPAPTGTLSTPAGTGQSSPPAPPPATKK